MRQVFCSCASYHLKLLHRGAKLGVGCRLQHETDAKEQLRQRCADLDARLNKLSTRNETLVDELRQKDAEAATANGGPC